METIYEKYMALPIDKGSLCLEYGDIADPYFCYPVNANPIGFEGCILYCFLPEYGEMVFACNPESCVDQNVYPLAANFEDFIRLILACGTANPLEQIVWMDKNKFEEQNQVYIVVSEGIRNAEGKFIAEAHAQAHDKFGDAQLGGVGNFLKNLIISSGITSRVKSLELGVLQRCAMHCASNIDIEEAYEVGYEALKQASLGKCGYMIGIKRESNSPYKSSYFLIEADKVANNVKYFPTEWIYKEGNNIKPEALEYLTPLISSVPSVISSVAMPSFKVFNKQFN